MKIEVSISKRHFAIILAAILLLGLVVYVNAAVNTAQPYHPLKQVSISDTDTTSVDENNNEVIDISDNAYRLGGIPANQFCRSDNNNCPSECKDFKVETTGVTVRRDNNHGADPDCWISDFGGTSCTAKWGDGNISKPIPSREYCAKTAGSYSGIGDGWQYYNFDLVQIYDSTNPFNAPKGDACGSGDTKFDVLRAKYYRISASCNMDGVYKTFIINSSIFVP